MKALQALALLWAALIFVFSIVSPPTAGTGGTATLHFAAYAVLAALALNSSSRGKLLPIFTAIMLYGLALEILQPFVGRTFALTDVALNSIGVLTATAIYLASQRKS